ncbi:MAG: preprotein translocase subunit SecA [Candidatus Marinimicrobia bacterium]|nr:preprotein translocase subunit SecA [Candidatus Neomarinimicrobiota bacterium]
MIFDKLLIKLFGTPSDRYLKKIAPIVDEINQKFETLNNVSDDDLRKRTQEMIALIDKRRNEAKVKAEESNISDEAIDKAIYDAEQSTLDELKVEAFAIVKQASKRLVGSKINLLGNEIKWNMIPFDVQLLGADVLHNGNIAEMKTGEGKTLVATMPIFLNALTKRGVHVVTVNDYLAERDAEWMGVIYRFLGLSVGKILNTMPPSQRKEQYACDIVYGTNNEFGFDYLRDNMAIRHENMVQRGHYYAIVDEVDSALIDEARTPLIISGPVQSNANERYKKLRPQVEKLVRAQKQKVNRIIDEIQHAPDDKDHELEMGTMLLQVQHGEPKNPRFMKMMQSAEVQDKIFRTESYYMQEKRLHEIDDSLLYAIDEKSHTIVISDDGRKIMNPEDPEFFVIPDIGEEFVQIDEDKELSVEDKAKAKAEIQKEHGKKSEMIHNITQLLRAYALYEKDVEYVVKDGKVLIVDEFTGRILPGRRYSDGLHQAIEAKEKVRIEGENQTLATITLQNYFRMYDKLSGMTGTAATEANEFEEIYNLQVVTIPTNQPIVRNDQDDQIYKSRQAKHQAIINEIAACFKKGQPVLVGTISVEISEMLGKNLKRAGIPHNVLNAKQHQREAEVVSLAGQIGAVTIATNMAGRGTDIKITDEVRKLGGLKIIGTERHESRRIDNQLRGRAGRQGDPGASVFFISLEDDLMRLFGNLRGNALLDTIPDDEVIAMPIMSRMIEKAQKRVEERNFGIRKHLLEYDDVMNKQREVIYDRRSYALEGGNLKKEIASMQEEFIASEVEEHTADSNPDKWLWDDLRQEMLTTLMCDIPSDHQDMKREKLIEYFTEQAKETYERKLLLYPAEIMRDFERWAYLNSIDGLWKEHLYELDQIKEGVGLQAYGQKDPLLIYKSQAFESFQNLLAQINKTTLRLLYRTDIRIQEEPQQPIAPMQINQAQSQNMAFAEGAQRANAQAPSQPRAPQAGKTEPVRRDHPKVGRNDPCPCGSGKKYKNCCGQV